MKSCSKSHFEFFFGPQLFMSHPTPSHTHHPRLRATLCGIKSAFVATSAFLHVDAAKRALQELPCCFHLLMHAAFMTVLRIFFVAALMARFQLKTGGYRLLLFLVTTFKSEECAASFNLCTECFDNNTLHAAPLHQGPQARPSGVRNGTHLCRHTNGTQNITRDVTECTWPRPHRRAKHPAS